MATFVTNYLDSNEFSALNSAEGPGFLDIEALGFPLGMFAGSPRVLDLGGDQNANHVTGTSDGGMFHAVSGSGSLASPTSWNVNGLVIMGGPFLAIFSSTAGLTLNPPLTDDTITGTINAATLIFAAPGEFVEFDFTGALSTSSTTFSVTHLHYFAALDGMEPTTTEGTIGGAFTINLDTGAIGGNITSVAMSFNDLFLEASGLSISAATFLNADTAPEFEALYGQILAGNDAITGTREGGHLDGFAGNDTITAGASGQILNGGAGADVYEIGDWGGLVFAEAAGQGTDTVRSAHSYGLQEGSNVENLILTGNHNSSGNGNELANTIVGNAGRNHLDGATGADSLVGGGGDDQFFADNAGDKFGAEAADYSYDTVYATVSHTLGANFEDLILDGAAAINGTGNASENYINGNDAANVLTGAGGDDGLYSNGGNDKLDGGDGNDYLDGGTGSNTLSGGAGDDQLYGGGNVTDNDLIDGGAGNDYVQANQGANTVLGGAGDDNVYSSNENDLLNGGDGNDYLQAGGGANTVLGGAGDDDLYAGNDNDFLDGGAGNDYVDGGDGANSLYGGAGDDTIAGGASGRIDGGAGNDSIEGGDSGSTLLGGAGNDSITSSNGADSIDAGAGIDTVTYTAGGTVTVGGTIENFALTNGAGTVATGNAAANDIVSGAGADSMNGGLGNDTYHVNSSADVADETAGGGGNADLVITDGNISFTLGAGIERLTMLSSEGNLGIGNELNNVLTSGTDYFITLEGGLGNDTYNVFYSDHNTVNEDSSTGGGTDLVNASLNDGEFFTLNAFIENLTLFDLGEGSITGNGNGSANILRGALTAGANNNLYGMAGADTLVGGTGNDWLDGGGQAAESLVGGAGDDTFVRYLQNTAGNTTMVGGTMADTGGSDTVWFFSGGDVNDSVFNLNLATQAGFAMIDNLDASEAVGHGIRFNFTGNGGNNRLTGSDQSDTLTGGAGNDTLIGGTGNDSLVGGAGNDYYVKGDDGNTPLEAAGAAGGTMDIVELLDSAAADIATNSIANIEGIVRNDTAEGSVSGGDGNDFLGSKGGAHTLAGGLGNDTYSVHLAGGLTPDAITDTGGTKDLVIASLLDLEAWTLVAGLENLTLLHGEGTVTGIGNDAANVITGAAGADAHNSLSGMGGADTLLGGAGNDTLDGGSGTNSLAGGLGDDRYLTTLFNPTPTTVVLDAAISDTGGNDTLVITAGESVFVPVALNLILGAAIENLDLSGIDGQNVNATGNLSANVMTGNGGNNILDGGAGDDSLDGGFGSDSLYGSAGADTLDGGADASADILDGGAGDDMLYGGDGNDAHDGGLGDDTYVESAGDDTYVIAQAGDTVIQFGPDGGTDTLIVKALVNEQTDGGEGFISLGSVGFIENATYTGTGAVRMFGNGADNVLTANAGNDVLDGGEGSDTLVGGAGNDDFYGGGFDGGDDSMKGEAGNDTLDGGEGGSDTLFGGDGNDMLQGGDSGFDYGPGYFFDGNDYLDGGKGNDRLHGGEGGSDTLFGGDGDDLLNGGDTGMASGDVTDVFIPDGNDSLNGNAGNDTLDGGKGGADTLMGELGNDSLFGGHTSDVHDGFDGGEGMAADGNDYLDGGAGNDTLDGGEGGADTLIGGDGNDVLYGGTGSPNGSGPDPAYYQDGSDSLDGGAGNDTLDGGEGGADTLAGGDGNDSLLGGSDDGGPSNDSLSGDAGSDTLDGGNGADTMAGGAGNDFYLVNDSNDKIVDEAAGAPGGTDTVIITANSFTVGDNIEKITLGAGGGEVYANAQANTIVGNSANNLIAGGGGSDTVTGGGGADLFVLGWGSDTIAGGNVMAIQDFHFFETMASGDLLGLNTAGDLGFSALFAGDVMIAGAVTNGTAATAAHAQLIYTYGNATTPGQLFYDADGTGEGAQVLVATFAVGNKPVDLHENSFVPYSGVG